MVEAAPAGVPCPAHPLERASSTCSRCGRFLCSTCASEGAADLCGSCASRRDPAFREPFGLINAVRHGARLFWSCPERLAALAVLAAAPAVLVDSAVRHTLGVNSFGNAADILILEAYWLFPQAAALLLMRGALGGDSLGMFDALGKALALWPRLALAKLSAYLYTALGVVLFIVPGLIRFTSYLVLVPAAVYDPGEAVDRCEVVTPGHRWKLLKLYLLVRSALWLAALALWVIERALRSAGFAWFHRVELVTFTFDLCAFLGQMVHTAIFGAAYLGLVSSFEAEEARQRALASFDGQPLPFRIPR